MKNKRIIKWGIPIAILICIFSTYFYYSFYRNSAYGIYFFNLDRGRSIFIYSKNSTILIDGGQNNQIIRELTRILPFYKRTIDSLILTSSDKKNIGGLIDLIDRYKVNKIIKPEIMGTSTALSIFEENAEKKNIKIKEVKKGDIFNIDSISFSILFPDSSFKYNKTSLPEMILYISYESFNILLLGDVSKTIQKSLISEIGKVNILEYAYSASDSRTSWDLFDKVDPDFVIISKATNSTPFKKRNNAEIINLRESGTRRFSF